MINIWWIIVALWVGANIGFFFGVLMRVNDNNKKGK